MSSHNLWFSGEIKNKKKNIYFDIPFIKSYISLDIFTIQHDKMRKKLVLQHRKTFLCSDKGCA